MRKRNRSLYPYLFLLILAITNWFVQSGKLAPKKTIPPASAIVVSSEKQRVKRVIDGDTIELDNGQKLRYIGVDTPETKDPKKSVQCFGSEAYLKNKELVEGKEIRMEKDVSEVDRYGRLLRYVYVMPEASASGELFVNEYLVAEGYAYAATFPPDVKFSTYFQELQKQSEVKKKGLWSKCPNPL